MAADGAQLVVWLLMLVLAAAVVYLAVVVSIPLGRALVSASQTAATALATVAAQFEHFAAAAVRGTVIFAQGARGAFATALRAVQNAFDTTAEFSAETFARALSSVSNITFGAATQISSLLSQMLATIGSAVGNLAVQAGRMVQDAVTKLVLTFVGLISQAIRFVINLIATGIQSLLDVFNQIAAAISLAIDASTSGALTAINALNNTASNVLGYLQATVLPAIDAALSVFNAIASIF